MARFKPAGKKLRLAGAYSRSKSIPSWVIAKTRGKVRTSSRRRNWRRSKLKI